MKLYLFLALSALCLSPLAFAEDCANAQTQADINQCSARQNQDADKQLNIVYQQLSQRLKGDPSTKKLLVTSQRAWLGFRDAECKFASSRVKGGSAYPAVYSACLAARNTERTQALKAFLQCQEGDLSCPVPGQ